MSTSTQRPQWFNADLFRVAPFDNKRTCIAPTKNGGPCPWDITIDEMYEANIALLKAQQLEAGAERIEWLDRLVLARCCGDCHREKIEGEHDQSPDKKSTCLRLVANRYEQVINRIGRPATPQTLQRAEALTVETSPSRSPRRFDRRGNVRHQHILRPRDAATGHVVPGKTNPLAIFQPWDREEPSIFDTFQKRIPDDYVVAGWIYAFSWPEHPGFIKIGYSNDVATRVNVEWDNCHRGATLLITCHVKYPRRIEELIHAQLQHQRRKIVSCANQFCRKTHIEWFEISVNEGLQTVKDWATLTDREMLYSSDLERSLTPAWRSRIAGLDADITARSLLGLLDAECESREREARKRAASERAARQRERAGQREARERQAAERETRDRDAREREAAEREARKREAQEGEARERQAAVQFRAGEQVKAEQMKEATRTLAVELLTPNEHEAGPEVETAVVRCDSPMDSHEDSLVHEKHADYNMASTWKEWHLAFRSINLQDDQNSMSFVSLNAERVFFGCATPDRDGLLLAFGSINLQETQKSIAFMSLDAKRVFGIRETHLPEA